MLYPVTKCFLVYWLFTQNIPANTLDTAQIVNQLRGIVSTKTLLGLLPFVKDVDEELKEIGRLKGIYLAQLTKYSIKSFKNGLEDAMKEAEGIMEGFKQGFEDIED